MSHQEKHDTTLAAEACKIILDRAEAALEFGREQSCNAEINRLRVETLESGDELMKIRARCQDEINQARDAALAALRTAEGALTKATNLSYRWSNTDPLVMLVSASDVDAMKDVAHAALAETRKAQEPKP